MSKSALIILSEGFEDIEAVAPIDILTRSGVKTTIAGVMPGAVAGAYGTTLVIRTTIDEVHELFDAVILPGGMANAEQMARDRRVADLVQRHYEQGKLIAAICASSALVLGEACGILRGKRATGFPGLNHRLTACGATVTGEHVTVDGNIISGMGPGAAMAFGLKIAEFLVGAAIPIELAERWQMTR